MNHVNEKRKLLIQIYPSNMEHSSRIFKMISVYKGLFPNSKVCLAGYSHNGKFIESELDDYHLILCPSYIIRLPLLATVIHYLWWNINVYRAVRKRFVAAQYDDITIQSNSVFDLPVSVYLKKYYLNKVTKCRLIYDAHELETESNGLQGFKKLLAKQIEKRLIKQANKVVVVGFKIRDWYSEQYGINPEVVRNIPRNTAAKATQIMLKELPKITADQRIKILYLGSMQNGRGLKTLLEAVKDYDSTILLVLTGYGPIKQELLELAANTSNVIITDPIPHLQLESYCSYFDLGVTLIENSCLSYYYCLPNKLFEYYAAKLPVICSNFPEMSLHVQSNSAGFILEPSVDALKEFFENINQETIAEQKRLLLENYKPLTWEQEAQPLKRYYYES